MTWDELKQFCNSLPDEVLKNNVVLWREDEAISPIHAERLTDDQYIGEDDEGCYPASEASVPIDELEKVYSKGDPILWEEL